MFLTEGKIIRNAEVKPSHFLMEINAPSIAKEARPGQFVNIRCNDTTSPLLRRPFSFHRIGRHSFSILYEVKGKGTRILANKRPQEKIDLLGPLGNGFTIPKKSSTSILVAGGMGVAPLVALAEVLAKGKGNRVYAIIGARNKKRVLCEEDFKEIGIKPIITTDDGSYGKKALATEMLDELFSRIGILLSTVFSCGPEQMLKRVGHIVRKRGFECYASLEENIACGVGACLGCAVKTKSGYKSVCKDGPVFNLNELIW